MARSHLAGGAGTRGRWLSTVEERNEGAWCRLVSAGRGGGAEVRGQLALRLDSLCQYLRRSDAWVHRKLCGTLQAPPRSGWATQRLL